MLGFSKEQQAGSRKPKNPGKIQAMTPKRRNLEAEKKEAYKRIDASRLPICEGCGASSCLSHSHRFPQAYQNYKYIAVDESIDIYCMEMANNCHSLYERGLVYRLKNGEKVMDYLMRTDYPFFMGKLGQMQKRISEENKKNWLASSQGLVSIPEWASRMISEHL